MAKPTVDLHDASDEVWRSASIREPVIRRLAALSTISDTEMLAAMAELGLSRSQVYLLVRRYRANSVEAAAELAAEWLGDLPVEIVDFGLGMLPGGGHLHHSYVSLYPIAIPAEGEDGVKAGFPRFRAVLVTPTGGAYRRNESASSIR